MVGCKPSNVTPTRGERMLTEPILDGRVWTRRTVGEEFSWTAQLPPGWLDSAGQMASRHEKNPGQPIATLPIPPGDARGDWQSLRATLDRGRGFVVLDRIPVDQCSPSRARALFWLLGHRFGHPMTQDVAGTLLFDVKDKGYDVTRGARFSGTTAESSFHTDNAFGRVVPDLVALLCLRPAVKGGESQLISAVTLHNRLLSRHADLLPCLYRPFFFDRRGEFLPGESPISQYPIFSWAPGELTVRYLHYYIEVGHQKAGRPLTRRQLRALQVLGKLLRLPELRVEFRLRPGQVLLTNNHWILHNRTAFEDSASPGERRHYLRLWISRRRQPDPAR